MEDVNNLNNQKNNSKVLLVILLLVIILIGVGIGVGVYLKQNSSQNSNRKLFYKNGNITIETEIAKSEDCVEISSGDCDYRKYYLNNIYMEEWSSFFNEEINVENIIDNDFILISIPGPEGVYYGLYDKKGNKPIKIEGDLIDVHYDINTSELKYKIYNYIADYQAALCKDYKDNDLAWAEYKIKYDYNNHKFLNPVIAQSETVAEVIQKKYKMSCSELKNTTNPNLEYEKCLATGIC